MNKITFSDKTLPENEKFRSEFTDLLKKYELAIVWTSHKEANLVELSDQAGLPPEGSRAVNIIFSEHPTLREVAYNDATVYAWFKQAQHGRCTIEEALVGALVWTTQEKQKYFDEVVEMHMKHGSK